MPRCITVCAFALFALVAAPLPALAQDATPAGGRDVPGPSECTVGPGTADEVLALYRDVAATPVSATPTAASPTPFAQPTGEPADAETAAAVEAANRELLACTNAYGFLGLVAVSTDRHIRFVLAQDIAVGMTEETIAEFLLDTPEPMAPEQSVALVAVRDVAVLEDGRIGAVTLYFIFVEEDGRYLLDEQFELQSDATPAP